MSVAVRRLPKIDPWVCIPALVLVGIGFVMIYSTTGVISREKMGDDLYYVKRQAAAFIIGFVCMLLAAKTSINRLKELSPFFLIVTLFLALLPLIPGIGDRAGGAQRWVQLPGVRFQPGEFAKLSFILFLAGYLARHENKLTEFKRGILFPGIMLSFVAALFLAQPDFGSTVVIALVCLAMLAASGIRLIYLGLGGVLLASSFAALVVISPYRLSRVISFLSPFSDSSGKGYQLIQSLIAVGSGQLYGVGLGQSQQKLFYLPAAHTDFIFAVIAEEFGFIGSVLTLLVFGVLMARGLQIARRHAADTFSFSLAIGLTLMIVAPALLNAGVVTGALPTKGMVLPLVGYGGSSLVVCMIGLGFLLALARDMHRPDTKYHRN